MDEVSLYQKQTVERILAWPETEQRYIIEALLTKRLEIAQKQSDGIVGAIDYTEQAVEDYKNFGKMTGLSTGFSGLDKLTKGLRKGELIILSAKTSVGKTSLALNVAKNIARNTHPVLFVTLEMTHAEIMKRMIHITGGLVDGQPTDDFYKAANMMVLQKEFDVSWKSIDGIIKRAKEEINAELVIIDHLHYFSREVKNPNEEMGMITKKFKEAAIKYEIPIITIAHTRKGVPGKEAHIDDIRGSSFITQDADVVLLLNRKQDDPNKIVVSIQKNRNAGIDWNNDEITMIMDKTKLEEERWI